jgi:hypothetical protein
VFTRQVPAPADRDLPVPKTVEFLGSAPKVDASRNEEFGLDKPEGTLKVTIHEVCGGARANESLATPAAGRFDERGAFALQLISPAARARRCGLW